MTFQSKYAVGHGTHDTAVAARNVREYHDNHLIIAKDTHFPNKFHYVQEFTMYKYFTGI